MSFAERARSEVREIGLVTLYFLTCFGLFLTLKKLFLEEYEIRVTVLGSAIIAALVVAKVVVLLGKTSFGNRLRSGPLAAHVLWRSLSYTAAVLVVTAAERVFDFYRESGELGRALAESWAHRDLSHFLAMNLCIGLSLVTYNALTAIDAHLGEGSLRRLFLSRPSRAE